MHEDTLYLKTADMLKKIQGNEVLQEFYLAGGTALALQLGHRKSIDLDFFSKNYPAQEYLLQTFAPYKPTITQQAPGTIDLLIDEVKVSLFEYKYPLLDPLVKYRHVQLASVLDIACMKLVAIAQRGTKKDFVDLYTILQSISFTEVHMAFEKKYKDTKYQKLHLLKSLIYFEDADKDPEPDYTSPIEWETVKQYLIGLVS